MNVLAFLAYSIVVTFTPGPSNILLFSTTQNYGYKKGLGVAAGASMGFGLLLIISAVLDRYLYTVIPDIKRVMGVLGAIYMLYLAWKILHMDDGGEAKLTGNFFTGFTLQFINPKAMLFTLTVFGNFVIPFYPEPLDIARFVAILTFIGSCACVSWVAMGTLFRRYLRPYQRQANIILCLTMVYCAWAVSGI